MIVDFHAHVYPEKVADKALTGISKFYMIPLHRDSKGTADNLRSLGLNAGIDKFVIHSVAQVPSQVININDFIARTVNTYPDHFIGFGTLHPGFDNCPEEIQRLKNLGLRGVKIHPDVQQFAIDDVRMLDIYARLEGNIPVLIHTGDYRYDYSHPKRLARVLDMFPDLVVIAAHFGGWSIWDLALEYLEHRFCYLDISSSIMFLGNRRATELIRVYGAERILFGSDYPMWSPGDELERFNTLDLTDDEKDMILSRNALRILENG
ncbi:MAG: amidohydrolase family protein [Clostridiales bacterium]|jgi:predicted TIM-barrel fold metal-dependent hydrolase|nr:amidohydrolase family protein [Clostridiales bacterium]